MPLLYGDPSPHPTPSPTPFDVPIPVGMPVNGIKVPYYDDTGRLAILIEADVAQKSDENTVLMDNLRLEALDEEERKIQIHLPKATLDLETRILNGDSSATISREDFTITGDTIEFDTKNRFGTMRGNIRMVVNTENSTP
ncbi:MAG: LPS export ABC transporter periplasmic protein LptC [Verrucomicrobiota bacterium]